VCVLCSIVRRCRRRGAGGGQRRCPFGGARNTESNNNETSLESPEPGASTLTTSSSVPSVSVAVNLPSVAPVASAINTGSSVPSHPRPSSVVASIPSAYTPPVFYSQGAAATIPYNPNAPNLSQVSATPAVHYPFYQPQLTYPSISASSAVPAAPASSSNYRDDIKDVEMRAYPSLNRPSGYMPVSQHDL
jgi:hypothetical protein